MKKVELEKEIERLTNENKKLITFRDIGQRFSNVAFNYTQSQRSDVNADLLRLLKTILIEWDKARLT